jgi:hypothetical protein
VCFLHLNISSVLDANSDREIATTTEINWPGVQISYSSQKILRTSQIGDIALKQRDTGGQCFQVQSKPTG